MNNTQWLDWAKRIQALSQSGLAFSKDIYDIDVMRSYVKLVWRLWRSIPI